MDIPLHLRWYLKPLFRAVPELVEAWEDPLAEWARETGGLRRYRYGRRFAFGLLIAFGWYVGLEVGRTINVLSIGLGHLLFLGLLIVLVGIPLLYAPWRRSRADSKTRPLLQSGRIAFFDALTSSHPSEREPWLLVPIKGKRAANLIVAEAIIESSPLRALLSVMGLLIGAAAVFLLIEKASDSLTGIALVLVMVLLMSEWKPGYFQPLSEAASHLPKLSKDPLASYNEVRYSLSKQVPDMVSKSQWIGIGLGAILAVFSLGFFISIEFSALLSTIFGVFFLLAMPSLGLLQCHVARRSRPEFLRLREEFARAWDEHWPEIAHEYERPRVEE